MERDLTEEVGNHGNFRALLDFRVDAGDTLLDQHLTTSPRNATYTSSSVIQNQIIDVLSEQIRQKIIRKVNQVKLFSVIADEVTDISVRLTFRIYLRTARLTPHPSQLTPPSSRRAHA